MNVYELTYGHIRHFVAAKDEQDAYEQGTDPNKFPDLHFRPFDIHLVAVEGYEIAVTASKAEKEKAEPAPRNKGGRPRKAAS